ncbi:MAG: SprT family protein [Lentilactobacillus diolivorans]|uniref:Zinc-metalloprotease n=2 Tax=Lentilactobacillus diolivorans TaxID=179838 RepID=A0A0R1S798_9LACO|nr:SprT family protein [Lentilactobacillus diolivorans]KRL64366.1 zinc-metalloprotease [Lentilactobacillus diolivorans DSM 14421]MDH5105736.1 SprT family protein [Lentilactobacillus diolivorans]RRG01394.1 MAG: SprT family protein [Lactobacillus sp.]GEP23141.1 protein SprT [Lentilactobacillus diolivorans]
MTDKQLQKLVEQVSLTFFAKPFLHHAYFNRRLKTTGGRYHLESHDIDINPKMDEIDTGTNHDILVGIIKHELCHYHLHLAGFSGKHNTPEFKQLLKAVGGSRYAPNTTIRSQPIKYLYRCNRCGLEYHRKRRIDVSKYVCGRCRGKLQLVTNYRMAN